MSGSSYGFFCVDTATASIQHCIIQYSINYLLTYDSYVPLYNRFHRGEWITRVSGGEGALDTPGPLNGTSEASAIWAQLIRNLEASVRYIMFPSVT